MGLLGGNPDQLDRLDRFQWTLNRFESCCFRPQSSMCPSTFGTSQTAPNCCSIQAILIYIYTYIYIIYFQIQYIHTFFDVYIYMLIQQPRTRQRPKPRRRPRPFPTSLLKMTTVEMDLMGNPRFESVCVWWGGVRAILNPCAVAQIWEWYNLQHHQ